MSLNAAVAMPSACAAMLGRDLFREASRICRPSPGCPSRLARGTRALVEVERGRGRAPRWPILSSSRPTEKPGVPFSSTSAEMALLASSISLHLPNTSMQIGDVAAGDEDLAAVDDDVVAVSA